MFRSKHKSSKRKKHRRSKDSENKDKSADKADGEDSSVKILKDPKDGKLYPKHLPKRMIDSLVPEEEGEKEEEEKEVANTTGKIIFSKIEEIPTFPLSPKPHQEKRFETNSFVSSEIPAKVMKGPKLSFQMNGPSKIAAAPKTTSTFAELSKKLGSRRKLKKSIAAAAVEETKKIFVSTRETKKMPPLREHIKDMKDGTDDLPVMMELVEMEDDPEQVVDEPLQVVDDVLEESYKLLTENNQRASMSMSRSRSRSRSSSRSSRSRSRSSSSRSSYTSRSRSGSYSSSSRSRSRSSSRARSRSPSIPRRKGSPSFLDRRRITSARKRPVPYKRRAPSPTPSNSSRSSSSSRSRSRSRSRSWSKT